MSAGVSVLVEDGFATIDFVDPKAKGPGLAKLTEVSGGGSLIETMTRSGPRRLYRVPEGNARAAGLLDDDNEVDDLGFPDTSSGADATGIVQPELPSSQQVHAQVVHVTGSTRDALPVIDVDVDPHYDAVESDGDDPAPSSSWSVSDLRAYADSHAIDLGHATKKADILAAINAAE